MTDNDTTTHDQQAFEKTPIYKSARMIMLNAQNIVANMPKKFKYSTGQKLNDECFALLELVSWAYVQQERVKRVAFLHRVYRKAIGVLIIHRISFDLNLLRRDVYVEQVGYIVSIFRQVVGWLKATNNPLPKEHKPLAGAKHNTA